MKEMRNKAGLMEWSKKRKELPDYIKRKNYHMALFISLAIGLEGLVMIFIALKDSNLPVVISTVLYSSLMFITFFHILITKKLRFFYVSGCLMVIALTVWFLYSGGTEGFGITWLLVIPLFTIYLMPYTGFILLNTIVLILFGLAMWGPFISKGHVYPFSNVFRTRLPLVYLFEYIFAFFLKHRINQTEHELVEQKDLLSTEINQAALIQKTFYKQKTEVFDGWDIAYTCIPMAGVSGDLYDFYPEKAEASTADGNSKLKGLGIYDISGHGISSGVITLLAKNIINQKFYENQNADIVDMLNKINERFIIEKGELENYITGILLRPEKKNSDGSIELEFVNAGHQPPVLYHKKSDTLEVLKNTKDSRGAIGLNAIQPNYIKKKICMEAGDELILYTDGVTDCVGPHKKELTLHGFTDLIVENISQPVDEQLKYIISQISAFRGEEAANDDMTIIIMRYTGN